MPLIKKNFLKFIRPSSRSVFNCHNCKGIKYPTRLCLGLSHLHEHKFKHSFQDALNPSCLCGLDDQTKTHFLVTALCLVIKDAPSWAQSMISVSLTNTNNSILIHILLFGKALLDIWKHPHTYLHWIISYQWKDLRKVFFSTL